MERCVKMTSQSFSMGCARHLALAELCSPELLSSAVFLEDTKKRIL